MSKINVGNSFWDQRKEGTKPLASHLFTHHPHLKDLGKLIYSNKKYL